MIALPLWFITNIGTVCFNKYIFKEHIHFEAPFALTMIHMFSGYFYSTIILKTYLKGKIEIMPINTHTYTK